MRGLTAPKGRIQHHGGQEDGQHLAVGDGERQHAPGRALLHPVLEDGTVLSQRAHAAPPAPSSASTHGVGPHTHACNLLSAPRCSGRSGRPAEGVGAAVDVEDLPGRHREAVAEEGEAGLGHGLESWMSQPSGARSAQVSSKALNPGIDLAAMVRTGPAATRFTRMPRGRVPWPGSGTATRARPWPRPSSRRRARPPSHRSRARPPTRRRRSGRLQQRAEGSTSALSE